MRRLINRSIEDLVTVAQKWRTHNEKRRPQSGLSSYEAIRNWESQLIENYRGNQLYPGNARSEEDHKRSWAIAEKEAARRRRRLLQEPMRPNKGRSSNYVPSHKRGFEEPSDEEEDSFSF